MFRPLIFVTLLAAAAPTLAFADFWQTEAGSGFIGGTSVSGFEFAPGSYSFPGITITNVGSPVPTVTARAINNCCGNAGAVGQWGYNFAVVGPENVQVPILARVVAHGTASATPNGAAVSAAQVYFFPDSVISDQIVVTGGASQNWDATADSPSFNIDQMVAFDETANYNGYIQGYASASTETTAYYIGGDLVYGHASASVYLDPYLSIDPVWSASHPGYSILVDYGYGNSLTGAVPEPASWALLCTGFGLVGAAVRRRRNSVVA